jgi:hypothetical protein
MKVWKYGSVGVNEKRIITYDRILQPRHKTD